MKTSQCKGCDKNILWGEVMTADGVKRIPLDASAPVYEVDLEVSTDTRVMVNRNRNAYVTHFATCPKASDFSGSKR